MSNYAPPHPQLFPMDRVWWLYGLFCLMILTSLFLDMRRRAGKESENTQRDAILNVVLWISFALLFCAGLYCYGLWSFPQDPRLAGFDPRAGITLWQKMTAANRGAPPQWLSTHPSGNNRIAEIEKHLSEVMPLYERARK